ncbi:hypothetical protein NRE95_001494 [Salmonella enterica]|nr:hypothetical protein [Salmonella enterica]
MVRVLVAITGILAMVMVIALLAGKSDCDLSVGMGNAGLAVSLHYEGS